MHPDWRGLDLCYMLRPRPKRTVRPCLVLAIAAALVLAGGPSCAPTKVAVRVPVKTEDVIRANEISRDGDAAFARRDFYAALIKYLEASRLNPNSEFILNKLGITYSQLKYYTEATQAFQRSMTLNPRYPFAYNNQGTVYFAQAEYKNAEKYFRRAIALSPKVASFRINLGMLYFERGKRQRGMEELKKGLEIDPGVLSRPDNVNLSAAGTGNVLEKSYYFARLYASMGLVDRAIQSLQQALKAGFTDIEKIRTEKDFDPIRQDERFLEFMKTAALLTK
jgi:tetratricopeptide (TPR) repeat protein